MPKRKISVTFKPISDNCGKLKSTTFVCDDFSESKPITPVSANNTTRKKQEKNLHTPEKSNNKNLICPNTPIKLKKQFIKTKYARNLLLASVKTRLNFDTEDSEEIPYTPEKSNNRNNTCPNTVIKLKELVVIAKNRKNLHRLARKKLIFNIENAKKNSQTSKKQNNTIHACWNTENNSLSFHPYRLKKTTKLAKINRNIFACK